MVIISSNFAANIGFQNDALRVVMVSGTAFSCDGRNGIDGKGLDVQLSDLSVVMEVLGVDFVDKEKLGGSPKSLKMVK